MPALPAQMTAIAIRAPGGPDMLVPEEPPLPAPGEGEVLVKVAAAGVNRPDVMQRQGLYPPPAGATDIPGLEIAGEVVAVGAGVKRWKIGDKVMALVVGGGYAEYCPAHESHALPVPEGLTLVEAAAIPETFFTVWHNVFERGAIESRRNLARPRRLVRYRHRRDPACQGIRRARDCHGGIGGKMRCVPKLGADVAVNYKSRRFRRRDQDRHRRQGCRRHPRHGRRRLYRAQLRGRGRRRAGGADRFPGEPQGHGRFPPHHAQAAHPHRLDPARPVDRR